MLTAPHEVGIDLGVFEHLLCVTTGENVISLEVDDFWQ